ncbi:ATP-binding cassette domain-containing protein [Burkholderia contaminans]|nr:ATP-binding cassette domain-containing protein [Burkholderia contaminans]
MYFDRRLWAMMAGLRWRVAAAVALGLLAMGVGILRFVFLGRVLALVFSGAPARSIGEAVVATAACVLLRAWLDHRRTVLAQHTAGRVQATLRARLFDRIAALGPAWFSGERTGGVMLAVVDGVEQLQTFFGTYLPQLVIAACAPVMIFAVLAWWDVPTAAILLVAALVTLALPQLVHRADKRAALARSAAFKAFGEEFLDAVQGLPTLKAFGQSTAFGAKLAAKARALSDSTFWVLALGLLTRFFTDLGTGLGAAAAIAVGAWRVRHGDMSLEALLIVLMSGSEIFRPLRDLRSVLHKGMIGQSAANAIHALPDADSHAPAADAPRVTGLRPEIAFDAVSFAYPGRRADAHAALSFSVREGETVAIVGPSGAGKSTIVRLLLRQHDAQGGAIRIGGHDVRTLDAGQVREMIAVVAQDATLFDGSVADNLRLGRPDASDADMIAAARAANAHDFISALPDGYATRIGERGLMLSGGQRQRLAIARALLRDAPILLLDEALSSVDAENEALIQQALDRLTRGRTTLVLAHRLSSVIGADRILVLDQGQVVDEGTHAALIARDGPYRRLMGPQLEAVAESVGAAATAGPTARASSGPQVRPLNDDAAEIGWPETLQTLLRFVRPWTGKVVLTVLFGIGRVLAFIGVGVIGALVVGAVPGGHVSPTLVTALLVIAPLAAVLHWLESWLAHDMAYRLLAEMRIALFATLERLAPAGLLRRRSGDLVSLATQDVETVEYFYAHTLAPAFVAVLVPAAVLGALAALGFAALPAVSQLPGAVDSGTAALPQRVLSDTPFPTAQHFVTSELARTIGERNDAGERNDRSQQPGLFAPLSAHRNEMLGYASLFQLAPPEHQQGMRAGNIELTLSDTLNRLDVPPEVRIQLGDLVTGKVAMRASAQRGDYYRVAYDTNNGTPHLTALELRVAGRTFGAIWFRAPGAEHGAYYALDGSPLEAAAFTMPVKWTRISSFFGERIHPLSQAMAFHTGVDLAAPSGTPVDAAADGVVSFVGTDPGGYGRYVIVDHADGYSTYYAHLSAFAHGLKTGETVKQGQRIGSVGMTGAATGPHLHFEVRVANNPVDPLVTLASAQTALSDMQLTAFRQEAAQWRFRLASINTTSFAFAQNDGPLWGDFATDSSTLRAVFNTHYSAS